MSLSDEQNMAGLFPKELRRLAKVVGLKSTVGTALDMAADEIKSLRASQAKMVEALRKARKQFRFYEREHRAKAERFGLDGAMNAYKDTLKKANVNRDMAKMCEAALADPPDTNISL